MSQAAVRRFGRARRILRIITVADKGNQLVTVIIIFVRSVSAVIDIAVLKNGDFTTFGISPPVFLIVKGAFNLARTVEDTLQLLILLNHLVPVVFLR